MLRKFIQNRIRTELPFVPNEGQAVCIDLLSKFLTAANPRRCFILRGYAGTGKTSVTGALVRALSGIGVPCVLLAPTGRAAKVMSRYSGLMAYTIHKAIYRKNPHTERFTLAPNMLKGAVFLVDEASMISADRDNPTFGSGSLLDDLVKFVYSGERCHMIVIGDDAQLAPVGHTNSPALDANFIAGYELNITEHTLVEVARQGAESGILRNATIIRSGIATCSAPNHLSLMPGGTNTNTITHTDTNTQEKFPVYTSDFISLSPTEVMETLEQSYREVGEDETLILTRSNFRTNLFNQGIRARILFRESMLEAGDRIMVSRNNYGNDKNNTDEFIANGEMFQIGRLRNEREIYGFHFADAEMNSMDRQFEINRIVWLDTLTTDSPEANFNLQKTLYERIAEDYPEIVNSKELARKIMENPYYNALQIRYAYAVTGHKAQGGQWAHIYIDVPVEEREDHLRWIYTAITRATEKIYWIDSQNV